MSSMHSSAYLRIFRRLMVLCKEFGLTDKERHEYASMMLHREVKTFSGLPAEDVMILLTGFNGYFLLHHLWLEQFDHCTLRQVLGVDPVSPDLEAMGVAHGVAALEE